MKQIFVILLFLVGLQARAAEFQAEPQNESQEQQEALEYKGFIAFQGGTGFRTDLTNLAEVVSLTYGGLLSRQQYLGSFEIGVKAFTRRDIPLTLAFKYSYSFIRNNEFELGPDISLFIAGDYKEDSTKKSTGLNNSSTILVIGNELGLFAMKYITNKISLLVRTGMHVENLSNPLIYIEGGIRWYFL